MPSHLRILLIGEEREGDIMPTYRRAFEMMGHTVQCFDHGVITMRMAESLFWKAVHKITTAPPTYVVSKKLRSFVNSLAPGSIDLTLVCQGMYLLPSVLGELKKRTGCLLFNWQTGDYMSPTLSSRWALAGIPQYDCIFSHGNFEIPRCLQLGARRAEYLPLGCNPELYRPVDEHAMNTPEADVVFVGHWRPEREKLLTKLASKNIPYSLEVWGHGWRRGRPRDSSPLHKHVKFKTVTWSKMVDAMRRGKIALAFLSRFDTGRVVAPLRFFEIPAAGGFMLAEYGGGEALEFFKEGTEIACFRDVEDLHDKIKYYIRHDQERLSIQRAGQERVLKSGYLSPSRLERILEVYREICNA
jgi:glycosyltransferase involved in cell wall biosynthesis